MRLMRTSAAMSNRDSTWSGCSAQVAATQMRERQKAPRAAAQPQRGGNRPFGRGPGRVPQLPGERDVPRRIAMHLRRPTTQGIDGNPN